MIALFYAAGGIILQFDAFNRFDQYDEIFETLILLPREVGENVS